MDGTLIDTEPLWIATEAEVAAELGCTTWTVEDQRRCLGSSAAMVASYIAERSGTSVPQSEIVTMLYTSVARRMADSPPVQPGAKELLGELDALGCRWRWSLPRTGRCWARHCAVWGALFRGDGGRGRSVPGKPHGALSHGGTPAGCGSAPLCGGGGFARWRGCGPSRRVCRGRGAACGSDRGGGAAVCGLFPDGDQRGLATTSGQLVTLNGQQKPGVVGKNPLKRRPLGEKPDVETAFAERD